MGMSICKGFPAIMKAGYTSRPICGLSLSVSSSALNPILLKSRFHSFSILFSVVLVILWIICRRDGDV